MCNGMKAFSLFPYCSYLGGYPKVGLRIMFKWWTLLCAHLHHVCHDPKEVVHPKLPTATGACLIYQALDLTQRHVHTCASGMVQCLPHLSGPAPHSAEFSHLRIRHGTVSASFIRPWISLCGIFTPAHQAWLSVCLIYQALGITLHPFHTFTLWRNSLCTSCWSALCCMHASFPATMHTQTHKQCGTATHIAAGTTC